MRKVSFWWKEYSINSIKRCWRIPLLVLWYVLRTIHILLLSPVTILVWLFYILPMWLIARDLFFYRWVEYGVAEFVLYETKLVPWHARLWRDWAGWGGPCCLIRRNWTHADPLRTRRHEVEHCRQQFAVGVLFYLLYFLMSIFIWVFLPNKHAYLDNPFEVRARRAAGQVVNDSPPGGWRGRDRWPWW